MMKGLILGGTILLDPAAAQIRWVILDESTGQLGSVDVPVVRLTNVPPAAPAAAPAGANPPEKPQP